MTRKDVDVVFLFNSYPGPGQEPASFSARPEEEQHHRRGSKHASRGPCDLNGIKRFQILAGQRYSLRSLVRWPKTLGANNRLILIQFFFGGCEFQALLQHPDAALKIELDGNNLGAGALILALALKICQASEQTKMD